MTRRIISFSLWGDNPKYTIGAIRNAELAQQWYPGWICRFYVSYDVTNDIIQALTNMPDTEVIVMPSSGWNGTFWRFLAADGDDVVISRDTDSRLGQREKVAVDAWLASDKDFHIMRDHPYHATEILAGMWGVRNGLLKGITQMIQEHDNRNFDDKYQVDQNFLREVVYPMVRGCAMVHDEFFEKQPFPQHATARHDHYFVGQVYDEKDQPEF